MISVCPIGIHTSFTARGEDESSNQSSIKEKQE